MNKSRGGKGSGSEGQSHLITSAQDVWHCLMYKTHGFCDKDVVYLDLPGSWATLRFQWRWELGFLGLES